MVELAVSEQDWSAADSLQRIGEPEMRTYPHWPAVRAASAGDTAALRTAREQLRDEPVWKSFYAAEIMARQLERYDLAEQLARDAAPRASGGQRARAHGILAQLALGGGRWSALEPELQAAARAYPQARTAEFRAACAALPFLPVSRAQLVAIRDEVAGWDSLPPAEPDALLPDRLRPHARLYALGLLSARLEEYTRALEYAAAIEAAPPPEGWPEIPTALAAGVRAYVALLDDRPADALAALEPVDGNIPIDLHGRWLLGQTLERLIRAEALLRVGRTQEALRWFENAFTENALEIVLRAPTHLGRAEAYEALGDRDRAAEHYARFLELWKDADPAAQPQVRAARASLERLTRERAGAE